MWPSPFLWTRIAQVNNTTWATFVQASRLCLRQYRKSGRPLTGTATTKSSVTPDKRRPWSEDELQRLFELRDQGKTTTDIGQLLARSIGSVKNRLQQGPTPPQPRKAWSQKDDDILCQGQKQGRVTIEIARELQRSVSSVLMRLKHLRQRAKEKPNDRIRETTFFTSEEDRLLFDLKRRGATWREIKKTFPTRSSTSLQSRVYRFRGIQNPSFQSSPSQFSSQEVEMLLRLKGDQGLPWSTVLESFPGRTLGPLVSKYSKLVEVSGPVKNPKKPWTLDEKETVLQLRAAGNNARDISRLTGRSYTSVRSMLQRLDLDSRPN